MNPNIIQAIMAALQARQQAGGGWGGPGTGSPFVGGGGGQMMPTRGPLMGGGMPPRGPLMGGGGGWGGPGTPNIGGGYMGDWARPMGQAIMNARGMLGAGGGGLANSFGSSGGIQDIMGALTRAQQAGRMGADTGFPASMQPGAVWPQQGGMATIPNRQAPTMLMGQQAQQMGQQMAPSYNGMDRLALLRRMTGG